MGADKEDRLYEDLTDMMKIQTVLQDYLDDYNMTFSKEVKLVFFQDAIEHVSRCVSKDRTDSGGRSRSLPEGDGCHRLSAGSPG